jgi:hypothetical protein
LVGRPAPFLGEWNENCLLLCVLPKPDTPVARWNSKASMSTPRPKKTRPRGLGPAGASWVALVAATSLGIGGVQRVRAAVTADPRELGDSGDGYRLIVQSYAPSSLGSGQLPAGRARPLASTQRAITAEQLADGVAVDMLGLDRAGDVTPEAPVIIAWVERGAPDLDFDGFEARPSADAFYGVAPTKGSVSSIGVTPVVLRRRSSV